MTDDTKDKILDDEVLLNVQRLDKEYYRLQALLQECDPTHVMLLLSTCLVQDAQSRGMDAGTLLTALCDIWNLTVDSDEVVTVHKKPSPSVMFPDKGVH